MIKFVTNCPNCDEDICCTAEVGVNPTGEKDAYYTGTCKCGCWIDGWIDYDFGKRSNTDETGDS